MPRFPGVSQCAPLPGCLTQHRTGLCPWVSLPQDWPFTDRKTDKPSLQSSLPAPISETLPGLLLWQWPSSSEVTLGLTQFHYFPSFPDLQQVITRRQINNHKWTVQKAGWWVLWHFKHLFDSKGWKAGRMQNNRHTVPTEGSVWQHLLKASENILPWWKRKEKESVVLCLHWRSYGTWTEIAIIYIQTLLGGNLRHNQRGKPVCLNRADILI